jgi:hypothetical protein
MSGMCSTIGLGHDHVRETQIFRPLTQYCPLNENHFDPLVERNLPSVLSHFLSDHFKSGLARFW